MTTWPRLLFSFKKVRTSPTRLGVRAFQSCQGVWHYSWIFRVRKTPYNWYKISQNTCKIFFRTSNERYSVQFFFLRLKLTLAQYQSNIYNKITIEKLEEKEITKYVEALRCNYCFHFANCRKTRVIQIHKSMPTCLCQEW